MIKRISQYVLALLFLSCLSGAVWAQQPTDVGLQTWLANKLRDMSRQAAGGNIATRMTVRNDAKQSDTPSISANTSSLVDRSSASDLVGIAMNLAGLTSNSRQMDATSMSATVSFYAFKAGAEKHDPLDPAFYARNRELRRWSATVGFDYPEDNAGDINERATIFGLKYLPYDKRDASDQSNQTLIDQVSQALGRLPTEASRISAQIQAYAITQLRAKGQNVPDDESAQFEAFFRGTNWTSTYVNVLTREERDEIDNIINQHLSSFVDFRKVASEVADKIRKKPQIAFAYLTKQRRETRPDEHVVEAIFDLPIAPRFTFTLNGTFNYMDNKLTEDSRGGRFAGELQWQMNSDKLEGRMPIFVKISGDGCWMTNMPSVYRVQGKVSIPLAEGIEIPLSVTYASRTDLVKEADVRGKFGLTFDVARIAQAFSGGLLGKKR